MQHVAALQRCLRRYKAEATLDLDDLVLKVRARKRDYTFYPQFLAHTNGRPHYRTEPVEDVRAFKGWLPYACKTWPTGQRKLAFKEFCASAGVRIPAMWRSREAGAADFIVKKDNSSFGHGLRGPFRASAPQEPAHLLAEDEYYEQFIRGRVAKAFYWDGKLACVELHDMPTVCGDGEHSLRELLTRSLVATVIGDHLRTAVAGVVRQEQWDVFAACAAYQGMTLDTIAPAGECVLVDFRYSSQLLRFTFGNDNVCKQLEGSALMQQFADAGPALLRGIPEALRPATIFSLDAIVDEQDRVWLLEMNANPVCHPDVYPLMIESLFGTPDALDAPAPPPASALPDMAAFRLQNPPPPGALHHLEAPARWRLS